MQACVRLLEIFGGLLNRPIIERFFEKKYYELLAMFHEDVQMVHKMFLKDKHEPPMHPNMAPCMRCEGGVY